MNTLEVQRSIIWPTLSSYSTMSGKHKTLAYLVGIIISMLFSSSNGKYCVDWTDLAKLFLFKVNVPLELPYHSKRLLMSRSEEFLCCRYIQEVKEIRQ